METASTTKNDKDLRLEFGEMVTAVERATAEAATPWKIATCFLAVVLAVVLLAGGARETQGLEWETVLPPPTKRKKAVESGS